MELPTRKHLRLLFFSIEVNLVLWITVAGAVWHSSAETIIIMKYATTVGFVVAALLQHWAYYNLYKRAVKQTADH
jgi:hypothetical protein